MIRITGEDRIKLMSAIAVEIFKTLPAERSTSVPVSQDLTHRATLAVDTAYYILEDVTKRVNGQ